MSPKLRSLPSANRRKPTGPLAMIVLVVGVLMMGGLLTQSAEASSIASPPPIPIPLPLPFPLPPPIPRWPPPPPFLIEITIHPILCTCWGCLVLIDPVGVTEFQLDVQFNPAAVTFAGLTYASPYAESAPPDLSNLANGQVNDISGRAVGLPPAGNAYLFGLTFLGIPGALNQDRWFTVSASANDFVTLRDPTTGQSTTVAGTGILGASAACPEPTAWALLGSGLAGLGIARKRRRFAPKEVQGVA